ncbi:MAG TPA: LUD domain-containing protein [Nitrososphaerales archaeon]|nr:LUD domain-containing protein [Nitrososphaerales archaeon]
MQKKTSQGLGKAELEEEAYLGELKKTKYGVPIDEKYSVATPEERVQKSAQSLRQNGFEVHVVDTPNDAKKVVEGLLPLDKTIFTASSKTLKLSGLEESIDGAGSKYKSLRKEIAKLDRATQFREQVKLGAAPDVVVGSVHAITESGQVFIGSATGSQLGPFSAGAGKVVWVVGSQKLVKDFDDAMRRLELYSLPLEDARMHEAMNIPSALAKILIVNREFIPGRVTIVLIRESIGF